MFQPTAVDRSGAGRVNNNNNSFRARLQRSSNVSAAGAVASAAATEQRFSSLALELGARGAQKPHYLFRRAQAADTARDVAVSSGDAGRRAGAAAAQTKRKRVARDAPLADTAGLARAGGAADSQEHRVAKARRVGRAESVADSNSTVVSGGGGGGSAAIAAMLASKRRRKITGSIKNRGFVYTPNLAEPSKQVRYSGLLDTLRAACYPTHDYDEARKLSKRPGTLRRKTGLQFPWQGRARGELAHQQVRAIVNVGEDALQALFGNERSSNAVNFLESLKQKRLEPLTSEFADYYSAISLASAIDLLCVRDNKLVLIEMKNGYDNTFDESNGLLTNPPSLRELNNSPRHQAYLQLLFYRKMLSDHYPDVEIGACYVAQVRRKDTAYHKLPKQFLAAADELVNCVAEERLARLAERQKGKK